MLINFFREMKRLWRVSSMTGHPLYLLLSRVEIVMDMEARVLVKGVIVNSIKVRSET